MNPTSSEREAFEKEFVSQLDMRRMLSGEYANISTLAAWLAWQVRASLDHHQGFVVTDEIIEEALNAPLPNAGNNKIFKKVRDVILNGHPTMVMRGALEAAFQSIATGKVEK